MHRCNILVIYFITELEMHRCNILVIKIIKEERIFAGFSILLKGVYIGN